MVPFGRDSPERVFLVKGTDFVRTLIVLVLTLAGVAHATTFAIVNAKLWTGDPAQPAAEAIVIDGERIAFVGTTQQARDRHPGVETVDAKGQLVVPGFIDSHVHFLDGGSNLSSVQLRDASSRDEFADRIREFAAGVPMGTWIAGGDWDHSLWGGELPTREWIDAVTPDHPVWVNRLDGHMALANGAALVAANVTPGTADVAGGEIVRDAKGAPTGIFKDNSMALVAAALPPPRAELQDRALAAAMRYVNAQGVTSVHHMGMDAAWSELDTFSRARSARALTVRVYAAVPLGEWQRLRDAIDAKTYGGADGRGDAWLTVGLLKGFVDGSLGSHTAAFYEPFDDAPNDRGLFINTPEDLYRWISAADGARLHVTVHAIGDRANGVLLDIYARVAKENGARDRRFRVEHAQHLAPTDIARFAALDVIPSMQPCHAIDDGRWAERVIGKRIATTYAFRSLIDADAKLAFGSDWPVAPATPLEGIYAAVTRRTIDDAHPNGWVPAQKITVEEALRAYTSNAAYDELEEQRKGALKVGYLADLVMIDRDIRAIPPAEIRDAKVSLTVVGGRIVYKR